MHTRQAPTAVQSLEIAERRNTLAIGVGRLQNRLPFRQRPPARHRCGWKSFFRHGNTPLLSIVTIASHVTAQAAAALLQGFPRSGRQPLRQSWSRSLHRQDGAEWPTARRWLFLGPSGHIMRGTVARQRSSPINRSSIARAACLPSPWRSETLKAPVTTVATRIESLPAGLQRKVIHNDGAFLPLVQTGGPAKSSVYDLAHRENHRSHSRRRTSSVRMGRCGPICHIRQGAS